MKDMTLNDILLKQDRPLYSLSVYRNGVWGFAVPTTLTKTYNQQQFYLMSESFGLVRAGTSNTPLRSPTTQTKLKIQIF